MYLYVITGFHQYYKNIFSNFFFLKEFIAFKSYFLLLDCKIENFQVVQLVSLNEFLVMKTPFYVSKNKLKSNIQLQKWKPFLVGKIGRLKLDLHSIL